MKPAADNMVSNSLSEICQQQQKDLQSYTIFIFTVIKMKKITFDRIRKNYDASLLMLPNRGHTKAALMMPSSKPYPGRIKTILLT